MAIQNPVTIVQKAFLLILLGVFSIARAAAAPTPAGTFIVNRAIAVYEADGQIWRVESNEVNTKVQPLYGISIVPNGTFDEPRSFAVSPGTTAIIPYLLTNTGNTEDRYALSVSYDTGSTLPFGSISLYHDANSNGILEAGEPQVSETDTLAAQQSISLLAVIDIRTFASAGQYLRFALKGVSLHDASKTDEDNWSRLTATSDSSLRVTKKVSATVAAPGQAILYTITAQNNGNRPAFPKPNYGIDVDGNPLTAEDPSGIFIQDTIPEGIHVTGDPLIDFPEQLNAGCMAVYGYENGRWSVDGNVAAWGGTDAVRHVGMIVTDALNPAQVLSFTWRGVVDEVPAVSIIRNNAVVIWNTGSETAAAETNIVVTQVRAQPAVLIGPLANPEATSSGTYRTPDLERGPYSVTFDHDLAVAGFVSGALENATTVVFYNTLQNRGSAPDTFNMKADWILDEAARALQPGGEQRTVDGLHRALLQSSVRFFRADGITPLLDTDGDGTPDTGLLQPGSMETVRVEVVIPFGTPPDELAHDLVITAASSIDPLARDTTVNRILFTQSMWIPLLKTASPETEVQPGAKLAYEIHFGNTGPLDAQHATLFDILPSWLQNPANITDGVVHGTLHGQPASIPVTASFHQGEPEGTCGTITWIFPNIPKGFSGFVSFDALVKESAPDGTVIENISSLTAEGMTTVHSNTTSTMVMRSHRLLLEKSADRTAAGRGALPIYTITVRNASETATILSPVQIEDHLPPGFLYVPGSATLDGLPFADPSIDATGTLVWQDVGELAPGASRTLRYKTMIGASASPGENYNRALAHGVLLTGRTESSNTASARILLYESLSRDSQTIIGRVYYDSNENGLVDEGEPGLPGIRIYLETGAWAITDSQGKYRFEDVPSGTHVIKLDRGSLPRGVSLLRQAGTMALGDEDSILVLLQRNELYKANFAVASREISVQEKDLARTGAELAGNPEQSQAELYARLAYSIEPSQNHIDENLVRVRIDQKAAGPLTARYLVIVPSIASQRSIDAQGTVTLSNTAANPEDPVSLIDPSSVYVDGALPDAVFPFEKALWIRLPDAGVFDTRTFDSKGGQTKPASYAQGDEVQVHYLAWAGLELRHFLVGMNPAGTITVLADAVSEGTSVLAREERNLLAGHYRRIQPEAATAAPEEAPDDEQIGKPGILAPREGDTFWYRDKITVQTASPARAVTALTINGSLVPESQIGRQSIACSGTMQHFDYIGVPLREGRNHLEFAWKNPDGTEGRDSITVFFAGTIVKIKAETRPLVLFADGKTEPELHLRPLDAEGVPLADGAFITVEIDQGRFVSPDANPQVDGFQARISNGEAVVRLAPEQSPVTRHLTVRAGNHVEHIDLEFLPFLRDWIVAGYGEASLRYTINQRNIFSEVVGDPDGFSAQARAAFFAKGTIFGCYLLTAALDTGASPRQDRIFGESSPDTNFTHYGDSATLGHDAASSDYRYLKIEKERSYFMYGDFTTGLHDTELTRYGRSFTGLKLHLDECAYDLTSFWTITDQSMIRDELRGDGTSGYYALSHTPIIENSDSISLETRSASSPAEVLSTKTLRRHVDYWINYQDGTILFKEPVRSIDDFFNPVYIVAVYEVRDGAERHGIIGVRPRLKLFDEALTIGGTGIVENTGLYSNKLYGADLGVRLGRHVSAAAELAVSDVYDKAALMVRQGAAATASFKVDFGKAFSAQVRVYAADREFRNPSLSSQAGAVRELSARVTGSPFRPLDLRVEALRRENLLNGDLGTLGKAEAAIKVGSGFTALMGAEYANVAAQYYTQLAVLGKLGARVDLTDNFTVTGFIQRTLWGNSLPEQGFAAVSSIFDRFTSTSANADSMGQGYLASGTINTVSGIPERAFLGGEYRLAASTTLSAGYEWLGGEDFSVGRVVAGIRSQLTRSTYAFANYGMEDSIDLQRNLANFGVKTRLELGPHLTADAGVEALAVLSGIGKDSYVAPTLALQYLGDASKHVARYEVRFSASQTRHLIELSTARKVDRALSWSLKDTLQYSVALVGSSEWQHSLLAGVAWRPLASDRVNLLATAGWLDKQQSDERSQILKGRMELHWQPARPVTLSTLYAFRWQSESSGSQTTANYLDLYAVRAMADVSNSLNAGIHAGIMPYRSSNSFDYYVGVEAGHRLAGNLYLSAGWNMRGLNNKDLVEHSYWSKGFFLTLRMKVDEGVLGLGN